jgi:RNA polymerase sigma factor (sigma-70 family)
MASLDSTCWTLVEAARAGGRAEREEFARRYQGPVEAYLRARWAGTRYLQEVDDGVQELFVECFRPEGILERTVQGGAGGFRAFLYGAVRNVALRIERRGGRQKGRQSPGGEDLDALAVDEASLSRVFDRSWALSLLDEEARRRGEPAEKRVELLRLRFQENLPIREIAKRWDVEAAFLHHEYAKAREELKQVLIGVVAFQCPGSPAEGERECAALLAALN